MRCATKCFLIILATATSGIPTREICFLPEQLKQTFLPRRFVANVLAKCATAILSVLVNRTNNLPVERRTAGHSTTTNA